MGNLVSCGLGHAPSNLVVKLVHCNGLVEQFYRPVRVGELTVDYPHHFICHSSDLNFMCEAPPPLSEEEEMELGQIYYLLSKEGMIESPLKQADVAALISKAAVTRKASYKGFSQLSLRHMTPLPPRPSSDMDAEGLPPRPASSSDMHEEGPPPRPPSSSDMEAVEHACITPPLTISREFIRILLSESRLKVDTPVSSTRNVKPAKSCSSLWRPALETIEEGSFLVN